MDVLEAFEQLKTSFPRQLEWRGEHLLNYAAKNGAV